VVLMDVMMPGMDGLEAMRRIRANPKYRNLPVIAITAKAMQNDQRECLDAGFSDYIAKPVNIDKLYSLLRVWVPTGKF
jgi:CheY-like chemotaxis protein